MCFKFWGRLELLELQICLFGVFFSSNPTAERLCCPGASRWTSVAPAALGAAAAGPEDLAGDVPETWKRHLGRQKTNGFY